VQETFQNIPVARVAADDPVRSKLKQVTGPGDRGRSSFRREGPLFCRLDRIADPDVVDLADGEARDLDRRVGLRPRPGFAIRPGSR
jgi:hypothetical protein